MLVLLLLLRMMITPYCIMLILVLKMMTMVEMMTMAMVVQCAGGYYGDCDDVNDEAFGGF